MSSLAYLLVCVTTILSPLYILRAEVVIPTTLLECLILASFILTLYEAIKKKKIEFKTFRTPFDILIGFFLATATLATFVSNDFIGGIGILKAYFIEPVLFYYCLTFITRMHGSRPLIMSLFITGIWISILGVIQRLTGTFTLAPHEMAAGRISAVYNSANALALILSPMFLLSLGQFLKERTNLKKLFYVCLTLLFLTAIYWTRSRGALIALTISSTILLYAVITHRVKLLAKIWYLIPLVLLLLTGIFFYQTAVSYKPTTFTPSETNSADTLQIRYFLWQGSINLVKDNPIFGSGLNGFKDLYAQKYRLPQFSEDFQYPHNIILNFWAETGVLGLISFFALVILAFSILIGCYRKSPNPYLGASLIAILTYILLHGMVDVPYFKNDLSLQFWTIMALIVHWSERRSS